MVVIVLLELWLRLCVFCAPQKIEAPVRPENSPLNGEHLRRLPAYARRKSWFCAFLYTFQCGNLFCTRFWSRAVIALRMFYCDECLL